MTAPIPNTDRIAELLADQALEGLSAQQEQELETLLAAQGSECDTGLCTTAAVLELSFLTVKEVAPLPQSCRQRLLESGAQWCESCRPARSLPFSGTKPIATPRRLVIPWLAAAACLALAALSWLPSHLPSSVNTASLVSQINAASDKVEAAWNDWDKPEVAGVKGAAVWCDRMQKGYLRLAGLPVNDPAVQQYQLWIIDERGMGQRISGAVFDAKPGAETIVEIKPAIPVHHAAAFAVTIEQPGGTWVSDMSRRVVIAQKSSPNPG